MDLTVTIAWIWRILLTFLKINEDGPAYHRIAESNGKILFHNMGMGYGVLTAADRPRAGYNTGNRL